jgi:hypothetical protein
VLHKRLVKKVKGILFRIISFGISSTNLSDLEWKQTLFLENSRKIDELLLMTVAHSSSFYIVYGSNG